VKQQQRERERQGHRKIMQLLQQHLRAEGSVPQGVGAGRQQQLLQEKQQRMRQRLLPLLLQHQPLRLLLLLQLHQLRQPRLQPPRQ
jgi:hypothetical protein